MQHGRQNREVLADAMDVQVAIHTDTLNESGFVEETIKAIRGRTIQAFHTEGAGGGHALRSAGPCQRIGRRGRVGEPERAAELVEDQLFRQLLEGTARLEAHALARP